MSLPSPEHVMPVQASEGCDIDMQELTLTGQQKQDRVAENCDTAAPCQPDQDATQLITGGKGVKRHADWTPGMTDVDSVKTPELDIANLQPVHMASGRNALKVPLSSPLTDVGDVLQRMKHGYTVDPLFDESHEAERSKMGLSYSDQGLWMKNNAIVVE